MPHNILLQFAILNLSLTLNLHLNFRVKHVEAAFDLGAIETLLISDELFRLVSCSFSCFLIHMPAMQVNCSSTLHLLMLLLQVGSEDSMPKNDGKMQRSSSVVFSTQLASPQIAPML